MGHTLVTRFAPESIRPLHDLMDPLGANKIPFGRDGDREAANREMDYHLTLFHWPKTMDDWYLPMLRNLRPNTCCLWVTGVHAMWAEEGSRLVYLSAEPGEGFRNLTAAVEEILGRRCGSFLHITLAVSKAEGEVDRVLETVRERVTFPFELEVEGLDLYHIWRPTKKVQSL